jgi:hypothetical protein
MHPGVEEVVQLKAIQDHHEPTRAHRRGCGKDDQQGLLVAQAEALETVQILKNVQRHMNQ